MPWICPICKKEFNNINQWHSCTIVEIGKHFENKPDHIYDLYNNFVSRLEKFGSFKINPVKTSIQFKAKTNFLSLKIKKNHMVVEFYTEKPEEKYPIYKVLPLSSNRWLACATLEKTDEITPEFLNKIKESFNICKKIEISNNL